MKVPARRTARKLDLPCGYVWPVYLKGTTGVSKKHMIRKNMKKTKAVETKMEAEMKRNQTVRTMAMAVTVKATIKGMKMSVKV
jgi:hypothetical protein